MPEYGPTGTGSGGFEFDEVAPAAGMEIGGLIIRYGTPRNVIAAFQVIWRTPTGGGLQLGAQHGSFEPDQTINQEAFTLGTGEFLIEIQGRGGQFLDSIRFQTNLTTVYGPFGGPGGHDYEFPVLASPREEIVGFFGRAGRLIDAIGIHTRFR